MKFLSIAGNIGAGKTTLTRMLAQHYGWEPHFEPVIFNPYIDDYYQDMPRWAFAMEVYYLKKRFEDTLNIIQQNKTIVQDRTISEGVYVFAKNNFLQGNLDKRDYQTFMELFQLMHDAIKQPDLLIFLKADVSTLVRHIQKRGREYEKKIQIEYLAGLNKQYDEFVMTHYQGDKIIVPVDELDFENNNDDFQKIIEMIDKKLNKLF